MTERILTLHPAGKKGVNILKEKYDAVRQAVLQALEENGTLSYRELGEKVDAKLGDTFEGSKMWYSLVSGKRPAKKGQDELARGMLWQWNFTNVGRNRPEIASQRT